MPTSKDPVIEAERRRKIGISSAKRRHTPESKQKIREFHIGLHPSEETRQKQIASHIGIQSGVNHPMFGRYQSEESRMKMSESQKKRFADIENHPSYGKKRTEASCKRMSLSHIGLMCGENASNWKGGISFEPYCPKFNNEFKERVRAFFGYQCVECGVLENGVKLAVHHVNFNKKTCCDDSIPLFVPLCRSCHGKTQKDRSYWQDRFTTMITEKYEGKCYLPKVELR